ncbi:MAG: cytochrome P450 [Acidobacteriota bacterium]|nr:cytochrome P450 [Acidobacteriota bacterium]
MVSAPGQDELRLGTRAFKANPYPAYARLRDEMPVLRVALPDRRIAWLVTRHEDVASLLRDSRFVKDRKNALTAEELGREPWMPGIFRPLTRNMLDVDAPDHGRLRGIVQKGFTPRLVERMAERIQSVADDLLDGVRAAGRMDLIRDYALPIPTTIIAEMLGVPAEDRHRFHRWSRVIVAADPSGPGMFRAIPSVLRFLRYIRKLIERRRSEPRDDLISALVLAEEEGQRLNADELVAMIFLLLIAGHETTVNLIGNGTRALIGNPDQMKTLRTDPELGPKAIEELLRFDGPLEFATERYAREDVEIRGAMIPRGSLVYAVLASANRDERQFANPDVLDLSRDPNRHLAFGLGVHFCLGAPLARLEGRIAIMTLLRRAPDLSLAVSDTSLRWRRGLVLRGLESLPVRFGR